LKLSTAFWKMPNLLVIGGGLGGCAAVVGLRKFDKDTEIIMVEPKDHCELYWAAYRSPFEPWVADGSLLSLTEWVETYNVKHVRSTVTKISKTSATLANGDSVDYDVVVVATGADSPVPFLGRGLPRDDGTKASRLLSLKEHGAKMLSANSIAVVGGGLVGTELAGDIGAYARMQGKDIAVTLIHSGPYLSHTDLSAKASKMVQGKLEKIGVKVILGERVNETDGKFILAKSGESLDADQVIMTTGITPVNCFLKKYLPRSTQCRGMD
jgi:NADH dehydrogenase FAD-containing subunit